MRINTKLSWAAFFFVVLMVFSTEFFLILAIEENIEVALIMARYVAIISVLFAVFIFLASIISKWLFIISVGVFGAFSLFSLKLNFYYIFMNMPPLAYFGVGLVVFFAISAFAYQITRYRDGPGWLPWFLLAVLALTPIAIRLVDSARQSTPQTSVDFASWQEVRFERKPNIYLFGFDSLSPVSILQQYLGIETLSYEKEFQTILTSVEPALSAHVFTRNSLNSIMRLDQASQALTHDLFSGRRQSILGTVLHANGYFVGTGFPSSFLGHSGPFVDQYTVPRGKSANLSSTALCFDAQGSKRLVSRVFYACFFYKEARERGSWLFALLFGQESPGQVGENEKRMLAILNRTGRAGDRSVQISDGWLAVLTAAVVSDKMAGQPRFNFFHTVLPIGHTPPGYNNADQRMREDFKEYYVEGSKLLSRQIQTLYAKITDVDPQAIVLIFGDHGSYLSQQASKTDDPIFYFKDHNRIMLGVMKTDNHCASDFERHFSRKYATVPRVLLDIFVCLGASSRKIDDLVKFDEDPEMLWYALQ